MKKNDRTTELLTAYADQTPDKDRTLAAARAALRQKADKKRPNRFAALFPVFASFAAVAVVLVLGISGLLRFFGKTEKPSDPADAPSVRYYTTEEIGYRTIERERAEALTGVDFGETENAAFRLYSFKTGGDAMVRVKLRIARDYGYDEITVYIELTADRTYKTIAETFERAGTFYEDGEYVTRQAVRDRLLCYVQIVSPSATAADDYLSAK